jgi:hypothetical protein
MCPHLNRNRETTKLLLDSRFYGNDNLKQNLTFYEGVKFAYHINGFTGGSALYFFSSLPCKAYYPPFSGETSHHQFHLLREIAHSLLKRGS